MIASLQTEIGREIGKLMKKMIFLVLLFATNAFGAGKDFIPPNLIITNGAMASTNTLTSSVVDIRGFDNVSLQANWTGTPSGTFYVDVCSDYNINYSGRTGNWSTLPQTLTAPSGSAGTSFLDAIQTSAPYIRVRYANSSGSGTLNVYIGAKAL
jgi:hypothetical protein